MTHDDRPEPGTPEFAAWLAERSKGMMKQALEQSADGEAWTGLLCGDPQQLVPSSQESLREDLAVERDLAKSKRHLRSVD